MGRRRRPIRIVADVASAAVVASVPLAATFGVLRIEYLYVVALAGGTFTVFSRLANSALIPLLVRPHQLLAANSAMLTSASLALIAGPALAGWLVQMVSPPVVLWVDAASFVVSAACFVALREPPSPPRDGARGSLRAEIGEGLRWLRADAVLFRLTVSIGLALGIIGPTALVGTLLAAPSARRFGLGPTLVISLSGELLSRVLLIVAGGPRLRTPAEMARTEG